MAGSIEHSVDVQLIRVLNIVVALTKVDITLISVHCEDLIRSNMERNKVLHVLCCALVLQVTEPTAAWDPRVAIVCPYDHFASRLFTASVHRSSNPFPDSARMLLGPVLADLIDVVRVTVVVDAVKVSAQSLRIHVVVRAASSLKEAHNI